MFAEDTTTAAPSNGATTSATTTTEKPDAEKLKKMATDQLQVSFWAIIILSMIGLSGRLQLVTEWRCVHIYFDRIYLSSSVY